MIIDSYFVELHECINPTHNHPQGSKLFLYLYVFIDDVFVQFEKFVNVFPVSDLYKHDSFN